MSNKIIIELYLKEDLYMIHLDPKARKNLNIRIKPNNIIHVSKPAYFSKRKLIKYLEDHEDWIKEKSESINALYDVRNSYQNGNEVIIFDESYPLENNTNLKKQLNDILYNYIIENRKQYDDLLNQKPEIIVKAMKGKWGYCVPQKNKLYFNPKLVHYPKEVIDYVILHEYTHLKIPNHSREFYKFIEAVMPNYREYIKYLREH